MCLSRARPGEMGRKQGGLWLTDSDRVPRQATLLSPLEASCAFLFLYPHLPQGLLLSKEMQVVVAVPQQQAAEEEAGEPQTAGSTSHVLGFPSLPLPQKGPEGRRDCFSHVGSVRLRSHPAGPGPLRTSGLREAGDTLHMTKRASAPSPTVTPGPV